MEKHKCKLCFRSFSNGRALGGHMRSHMMNLPIPPKLEGEEPPPPPPPPPPAEAPELGEEADSASSSSSSSSEEEEEAEEREEHEEDIEEKELYYGLRENPKRSIRLVDPEFSFAATIATATADAASSVILQDRESETESSKNPTRRRSKRTRKSSSISPDHHRFWQYQKTELVQHSSPNSKKIKSSESEPVSSVSDAATDEDIAFCLMMLSRDNWNRYDEVAEYDDDQADEDDEEEVQEYEDGSDNESEDLRKASTRTRGKYKCETCNKVFRSYQALGGHRASHKKIKLYSPMADETETETKQNAESVTIPPQKKVHECPVCFRVFSSGQALGGHKRSHVISSTTAATNVGSVTPKTVQTAKNVVNNENTSAVSTKKSSNKLGEISLIDLNLPAPDDGGEGDEDDEISQIELSAVSDAEFVNPVR